MDFCVTSCPTRCVLCKIDAAVLRHPAKIEVLRICCGELRTAGAGTQQIRSAAQLVEVTTLGSFEMSQACAESITGDHRAMHAG